MQFSLDTDENHVDPFKVLLDRFCELANGEGIELRPYEGSGPSHFARLPAEQKRAVLLNFERYLEVAEQVIRNGERLGGNQFLWRMFQKLGVTPASTLMDHIESEDIVEIYNSAYVQIFRSLGFFRICSYTLDDLLCRPVWELFRRGDDLMGRIVKTTDKLLAGQISGVHPWDLEEHVVDEIESEARYRAVVRFKYLSPLRDADGNVACFVNVFRPISCVPTQLAPHPVPARETSPEAPLN